MEPSDQLVTMATAVMIEKPRQERTSLDIVIVNWNTGRQIRDCLESIMIAAPHADGNHDPKANFALSQVFVIDNASSDGSMSGLEQIDLPLTIIHNQENRGFGAACNQGARAGSGEYILFLNPDTQLFEGSLHLPLTFMQQSENQQIGICGIRLIGDDGKPTIAAARFPSLRVLFGKMSGLSKIAPAQFPPHMMSADELPTNQVVDQIIGAYFLLRRSVYELCGGFDERFFVYFEEVDLALRAKQAGFESYYLADATAYHKGGGATDAVRAHRLFYSMRSRMQYAHKHFSLMATVTLFLATFLVECPARLIRAVARGSVQQVIETCSGFAMLVRSYLERPEKHKAKA